VRVKRGVTARCSKTSTRFAHANETASMYFHSTPLTPTTNSPGPQYRSDRVPAFVPMRAANEPPTVASGISQYGLIDRTTVSAVTIAPLMNMSLSHAVSAKSPPVPPARASSASRGNNVRSAWNGAPKLTHAPTCWLTE
jgi:hypothetical protein